jgi:CRISPR/Cas system endoribonuclease Cas6 (RAMP superfamily)
LIGIRIGYDFSSMYHQHHRSLLRNFIYFQISSISKVISNITNIDIKASWAISSQSTFVAFVIATVLNTAPVLAFISYKLA